MKKTILAAFALLISSHAYALTANRVVKASSNTYITDSIIQDDGTGVGIGTAPVSGQKLAVDGTINSLSGGFVFPDGSTQTVACTGTDAIVVGTPITGGQTNSVLYGNASQNLSSGYFLKFNDTTGMLTVGGSMEDIPPYTERIGQVSLYSGEGGSHNTYFNLSGTNGNGMSIRGKHYSNWPVTDPMGIIISPDGGTHYAKMTSGGLGINTKYPQAALDVTGDAVVSGTMTAQIINTPSIQAGAVLVDDALTAPTLNAGTTLNVGGAVNGTINVKDNTNSTTTEITATNGILTGGFTLGLSPTDGYVLTSDVSGTGTWQVTGANGITVGSGGTAITKHLSATASLDFGATAAGTCDSLTITVTGAADGDTVSLGIPNALAASDTYQSFQGFVSSANTVTVKRCNLLNLTTALSNPGAETVRADVWQH